MRVTKPIATLLLSVSLVTGAHAQSLRTGSTPAEFPPASYKGNQYVDSRGCVYIRAGIDGNVTWVPRVSRDRKLVCGYKPTGVSGASSTSASARSAGVEQITLPPSEQATTAAAPSLQPRPNPLEELFGSAPAGREPSPAPPPTVFETTKTTKSNPAPSAAAPAPNPLAGLLAAPAPSPAPPPTVFQTTKSEPKPATAPVTSVPRTQVAAPSPGPAATTVYRAPQPSQPAAAAPRTVTAPTSQTTSPCPGASALSQQYIRSGSRFPVRCGPQAESPVSRPGDQNSALSPATRVVPLHVYQQRANATNLPVPDGYRPVWEDDRLNPHRAERTLAAPTQRAAVVPPGYRPAWDDDRLNPMRGVTSATGNAQTATLWTDDVPRQAIIPAVPESRIIRLPKTRVQSADTRTVPDTILPQASSPAAAKIRVAPQPQTAATRTPKAKATPRYVRVGAFGSDAEARKAAQSLARASGLPIRLGNAKKGAKTYKVVLAGPFTDPASAKAALQRVRAAGYAGAKLNR